MIERFQQTSSTQYIYVLLNTVEEFYVIQIPKMMKSFSRGFIFSIILIVLKEWVLVQFHFQSETEPLVSNLMKSNDFGSIFFFLFNLSSQTQSIISYSFFCANIFIISLLWLIGLLKDRITNLKVALILSLMIKSYEYIFGMVFLRYSLIQNQVRFFNIGPTILLGNPFFLDEQNANFLLTGAFFVSQDYSIEISRQRDFLGKYDTKWNIIQYLIENLIVISHQYFTLKLHLALCVIINLLKLGAHIRFHQYHSESINQLSLFFKLFNFFLACILLLVFQSSELVQQNLIFMIFILIPISAKLSSYIINNYYEYVLIDSFIEIDDHSKLKNQDFSFIKYIASDKNRNLDILCRHVMQKKSFIYGSENQKESNISKLIQQLIEYHSKLQGYSFYQDSTLFHEFKDVPVVKERVHLFSDIESRFLIKKYVLFVAKHALKQNELNYHSKIQFLMYFLAGSETTCLLLAELVRFRQDQRFKQSWKAKQKLYQIEKLTFEIQDLLIQEQKSVQIIKILEFENLINDLTKQFYESIKLKRQVMGMLAQQIIDLKESSLVLSQFKNSKDQLILSIKQSLKKENIQSSEMKQICLLVDEYLSPNFSIYKKFELSHKKNALIMQNIKDFHGELSCIAQVSLLPEQMGIITRISRNFPSTFGYISEISILKQHISTFLPSCIIPRGMKLRDKSEASFQILSSIQEYNDIISLENIFIRNQKGYVIKGKVKIQAQAIEKNDFCAIIWIQPSFDCDSIIVLNSAFQAEAITKEFKYYLYPHFNAHTELSTYKIQNTLPIISLIFQSQQEMNFHGTLSTLLVKIANQQSGMKENQIINADYMNDLLHQNLYFVELQISRINNEHQNYSVIQIVSSQKLSKEPKKRKVIDNFMKQYEEVSSSIKGNNTMNDFFNQFYGENKNDEENQNITIILQDLNSKIKDPNNSDLFSFQKLSRHFASTQSITHYSEERLDSFFNKQAAIKASHFKGTKNLHQNDQKQRSNIDSHLLQTDKSSEIIYDNMNSNFHQKNQEIHLQVKSIMDIKLEDQEQQSIFPLKRWNSCDKILIDLSNNNNNKGEKQLRQINHQNHEQINQANSQKSKQSTTIKNIGGETYHISFSEKGFSQQQSKYLSLEEKEHENKVHQNQIKLNSSNIENHQVQNHLSNDIEEEVDDKDNHILNIFEDENNNRQSDDHAKTASIAVSHSDRKLILSIEEKINITKLKIINMLGFFSFIIIIVLTVYGFINFYNKLISQELNFKFINWLYNLNIHVSQAYSEYNIHLQQQFGLFKITNQSQNDQFQSILENLLQSRVFGSKDLLKQVFNTTDPGVQVFQIIQKQSVIQKYYSSYSIFQEISTSMLSSLILQQGDIYHFVQGRDDQDIYRFAGENNYPSINSLLTDVVQTQNDQFNFDLESIFLQAQTQFFVVLAVSSLFLLSIIPIAWLVHELVQDVNELFATLDVYFLKEEIQKLDNLLKRAVNQSSKDKNNKNSRYKLLGMDEQLREWVIKDSFTQITKKGNVSRVLRVPFKKNTLLFGLAFLFALLMAYPSANYALSSNFISKSDHNYIFNHAFCEAYFLLINCLRSRQGIAVGNLIPQLSSLPSQNYRDQVQDLLNQIPIVMGEFSKALKNQQISSVQDKEIYVNFISQLLEKDACQTISLFPQYQNKDFDYALCSTEGKGALNQGFLNGLNKFFYLFQESSRFSLLTDLNQFKNSYDLFNQQNNGYSSLLFKIELTKVMDYSLNFFQDQNKILYTYYKIIILSLFLIEIAFLFFLYAWGWLKYYRSINQAVFNQKKLLDILPPSILLQNNYIAQFLKSTRR